MRRASCLFGVLAAFGWMAVGPAAAASELISIPIEQVTRGDEGDEILVASADVPADLVGLQCEMVGETSNQDSVHEGNDLLIRLGDQVRVIENFEDERDIRYEFRQIEEMPARVDVLVRLGPDGVSSGGFLISIECELEPPTTTSTTTIEPPATTSEPPATTSEPPATTSEPPATTSEPPATSTEPVPTVLPPPASSVPPPEPPGLAVTGAPGPAAVLFGAALIAIGALMVMRASRPGGASPFRS